MRLFEVADLGSLRSFLSVKKGQADRAGSYLTIPFNSMKDYLAPLGINSPDALEKILNEPDIEPLVSAVLPDGSVVINTEVDNPDKDKATTAAPDTGPGIDSMASGNTDLSPDSVDSMASSNAKI